MRVETRNDMPAEIWKPVVGFEKCYEVSNFGRIMNIRTGKILVSNSVKSNGYYIKCLQDNGRKKYITIHRMVATAFLPNPYHLDQINHKNGIKTDNRVENLEWVTNSDNQLHSAYTLNNESGWRKRKVRCVDDGIIYQSVSEAARAHGVCVNNFPHVCGNPNRTLAGKHWEYV